VHPFRELRNQNEDASSIEHLHSGSVSIQHEQFVAGDCQGGEILELSIGGAFCTSICSQTRPKAQRGQFASSDIIFARKNGI